MYGRLKGITGQQELLPSPLLRTHRSLIQTPQPARKTHYFPAECGAQDPRRELCTFLLHLFLPTTRLDLPAHTCRKEMSFRRLDALIDTSAYISANPMSVAQARHAMTYSKCEPERDAEFHLILGSLPQSSERMQTHTWPHS